MNLIKSLSEKFLAFAGTGKPLDDDTVQFAGVIGADIRRIPENEFEFGFRISTGAGKVWLPATTSDERVISQIKRMKPGQYFKITREEPWGAMGTRVMAIDNHA